MDSPGLELQSQGGNIGILLVTRLFSKRSHNKPMIDRGEEFFLLPLSLSLLQVPCHNHGSISVSQNTNCLDVLQRPPKSRNDLDGLILLDNGSSKEESVT